nr:MFS transporter [Bradyrhizobium neotropicale]
MAGLGLAAPLGHLLAKYTGSLDTIYAVLAIACVIAAACVDLTRRAMSRLSALAMPDIEITLGATTTLLQKCTALPIAMIAISACMFAGLSTYQSAYSASRHLNADLFFLVFTATSAVLRFSVAHLMGSLPLRRLALTLILLTAVSLVLFLLNSGSTSLDIAATVLFAGYGLSYSTLNTIAVNLAGEHGVSVPTTSQIFTLAYFIGLFGFPMVGGQLVRGFGPDVMLLSLLSATALNAVLATRLG